MKAAAAAATEPEDDRADEGETSRRPELGGSLPRRLGGGRALRPGPHSGRVLLGRASSEESHV